MGYRPEFRDMDNPELCFYGTKLYGYVNDETKLPSYQYLLSIGKAEEDAYWDYSFSNEMILTADEFRKFMALYEKDFDEHGGFGKLSEYHDYGIIRRLLETEGDKHIEWG